MQKVEQEKTEVVGLGETFPLLTLPGDTIYSPLQPEVIMGQQTHLTLVYDARRHLEFSTTVTISPVTRRFPHVLLVAELPLHFRLLRLFGLGPSFQDLRLKCFLPEKQPEESDRLEGWIESRPDKIALRTGELRFIRFHPINKPYQQPIPLIVPFHLAQGQIPAHFTLK